MKLGLDILDKVAIDYTRSPYFKRDRDKLYEIAIYNTRSLYIRRFAIN